MGRLLLCLAHEVEEELRNSPQEEMIFGRHKESWKQRCMLARKYVSPREHVIWESPVVGRDLAGRNCKGIGQALWGGGDARIAGKDQRMESVTVLRGQSKERCRQQSDGH